MAELKAETKWLEWLEEEKEAAIREKRDYTINQGKLAENIQRDLETQKAHCKICGCSVSRLLMSTIAQNMVFSSAQNATKGSAPKLLWTSMHMCIKC